MMDLFKELAVLMNATEVSPLRLGNVEFWIDNGELVYSIPSYQWDAREIGISAQHLSLVYPEVVRIVARYA